MERAPPAAEEALSAVEVRAMRTAWSAHLKRRRSVTMQILRSLGDTAPLEQPLPQSTALTTAAGALTMSDATSALAPSADSRDAKKPNKVINPWLNDWSQHFVDTQMRPQNCIRRTDLSEYDNSALWMSSSTLLNHAATDTLGSGTSSH